MALVIGIEAYRDIPQATGARTDAVNFGMLAQNTLGLPASNVRILLNDRATKGDIDKEIALLKANTPPGGRIFFFYSGHGAPDASDGTPYLVPYDGDPRALAQTAVPLSGVLRSLGESKARHVVAFVDSCFSGAGGRSVLPPGTRPLVRVKAASAGSAQIALLTASTGDQISGAADNGMGLFTSLVLEGVGRGSADLDGDGSIVLNELHQWLAPRVSRAARKENREQAPSLVLGKGISAEHVVLAHGVTRD
jgi:uncharacterized caspase-like protein